MQNDVKRTSPKKRKLALSLSGFLEDSKDVVVLDEGTIVSPTLIELLHKDPQTVADFGLILQDISPSKLTSYLGNNFQTARIIENPKDLNGSVIEIDYDEDHHTNTVDPPYMTLYRAVFQHGGAEGTWEERVHHTFQVWEQGFQLAKEKKWHEAILKLGEAIQSKEMPYACTLDNSRFILYFHFIYIEAIKQISRFHHKKTKSIDISNYLVVILGHLAVGAKSRAVDIANKAIEVWPTNAFLYRIKARCMEAHRRYQTPHSKQYDMEIFATYSKAVELDPNDYLAFFERGSCVIVEPDQLRQSIADLKEFLKLAPEHHIEICAANYLIGCNLALLPGGCKVATLRKYLKNAQVAEKERIKRWKPYTGRPKAILRSMVRETSHIPFYMKHGTGPLQQGIVFNKAFNCGRWHKNSFT